MKEISKQKERKIRYRQIDMIYNEFLVACRNRRLKIIVYVCACVYGCKRSYPSMYTSIYACVYMEPSWPHRWSRIIQVSANKRLYFMYFWIITSRSTSVTTVPMVQYYDGKVVTTLNSVYCLKNAKYYFLYSSLLYRGK